MDLRNALTSFKEAIMAKIQLAASQQHTQAIIGLSAFAKQVDADLATLSEIEDRTKSLKDQLDALNSRGTTGAVINDWRGIKSLPRSTSVEVTNPSSRKQGMDAARIAREEFLQTCQDQGIRLLYKKRTLVTTARGALIALPFARTFPEKPDIWFLGINAGSTPSICPYRCIVFLCQEVEERVLAFIVPQKHLQPYWSQFSRHGGDVKFNIRRDGVNVTLYVPGNNPLRLNPYQEAYANLKDM